MTASTATPLTTVSRRVARLQIITLAWMSIEAAVSLGTAWHAHSSALFGFGGDSLIDLLSAAVVLWRFRFHLDERRASQIAGALLFALAGLIVLTSVLNFVGYREAQASLLGMGILLAAAVAMPLLASQKRKLAVVTSSASLKADAAESALCGYMAWIALGGLAVNAIRRVYRTTEAGQMILKAAKEKVRELFGELFEDEPVAVLPQSRPRIVSVRASNHRKQGSARAAQ